MAHPLTRLRHIARPNRLGTLLGIRTHAASSCHGVVSALRQSSSASASGRGLRRRRVFQSQTKDQDTTVPSVNESFGEMMEPYQHKEADFNAYLEKASLSPWVPLPDAVTRRVFDIVEVGQDDTHIDLGSGDGRVCFEAITCGAKSTVGIDVDEGIVEVARNRLAKRHPLPDNILFIVADLMDETHPAWEHVQNASIITMYFATEALEKFRPILERKLVGRSCKIVTSGYAMPGWQSVMHEVVLGTQIHLYDWGGQVTQSVFEEDDFFFQGPDILPEKPEAMKQNDESFNGQKVIDRTGKYPIRGFDPSLMSGDYDEDKELSDDENEEGNRDEDEDENEEVSGQKVEILVERHGGDNGGQKP